MIESAHTPPASELAPEGTHAQLPPEADDSRDARFSFSSPLRTRAARGTLINAAFSIGAGVLALLKGFILAGFLSRTDYGAWSSCR
jgi:hypothetical protein